MEVIVWDYKVFFKTNLILFKLKEVSVAANVSPAHTGK